MPSSLFLHAHPDDEAIFTGGTIALLKEIGQRVIVVFATGGQLGANTDDDIELELIRQREAYEATSLLGANHCIFLNYHDSGLDPDLMPNGAFGACDIDEASRKLSDIVSSHDVDSLFCDDPYGIYGHLDHVMAHKVGLRACAMTGIEELYFNTIDREYLHFVDTHLVEEASASRPHDGANTENRSFGMSSIEITHTVDVTSTIATKRASMVAHKSQINDTSSAFVMNDSDFLNVYGYEWYVRDPRGDHSQSVLQELPKK